MPALTVTASPPSILPRPAAAGKLDNFLSGRATPVASPSKSTTTSSAGGGGGSLKSQSSQVVDSGTIAALTAAKLQL